MYLLHTHCLDDVDKMNGTEFEYWCADMLRKLAYKQVTVTQESGDQRVDISALKTPKIQYRNSHQIKINILPAKLSMN